MVSLEPRKLETKDYEELINALEDTAIKNASSRNSIINRLSQKIVSRISQEGTLRIVVISIVSAFNSYPDKFQSLLDEINIYEQNSQQYQNLKNIVLKLAKKQEKSPSLFDLVSQEKENEVYKFRENKLLKSLWEQLCQIMEKIDATNIWLACSKIIDDFSLISLNKISLMEWCITKDFDSLANIFIKDYPQTPDDNWLIIKLGELEPSQ